MSFVFSSQIWRQLSYDDTGMIQDIASKIEASLNHHTNTSKPSNICAPFQVRDLYLGSEPPKLQILELSELTKYSFRAILSFSCTNDAYLVLSTKVQANPMSAGDMAPGDNDGKPGKDSTVSGHDDLNNPSKKAHTRPTFPLGTSRMLAANKPLIVPMHIRMIDIRIRALVRVSFHLWKGLTIKFINDPLESVTISTTFDALPKLRSFLQQDIESKLREAILRDLPDAIYQWSREWINHSWSSKDSEISTKEKEDEDESIKHTRIEPLNIKDSAPATGFTMSLSASSPFSPSTGESRLGLYCLLEDQKKKRMQQSITENDISTHHTSNRHRLTSWLKQGRHLKRDSMRHNLFYFSDLDVDGACSGLYFGRQQEEPKGLRQILSIMDEDENSTIQEVEDLEDISKNDHEELDIDNEIDIQPKQVLFVDAKSSDDKEYKSHGPSPTVSIPTFSFFVPKNGTSTLKIEIYKCTASNGNHHNGIGFAHNKTPL